MAGLNEESLLTSATGGKSKTIVRPEDLIDELNRLITSEEAVSNAPISVISPYSPPVCGFKISADKGAVNIYPENYYDVSKAVHHILANCVRDNILSSKQHNEITQRVEALFDKITWPKFNASGEIEFDYEKTV